ncbi:MAG: exodeoxyribonuclease VII large subunit [Patescibacteria group bacterium]|nr:exodeoxyribonuclease VII large subunit [Patescibacteria group bacterium]MDD5164867.1 exodeoxyribonuclease VII large subunit [Patescibacteria group bacterium]MDD5534932.1 exodeoxyribonuclease VII large subunit [Patescibacteria group bacterium]
MDNNLLQKLKDWRKAKAEAEGVPVFRVFSNAVIEAIAQFKPKDKEALFLIKGIRDRKYNKYGEAILALVNGGQEGPEFFADNFIKDEESKPFSVSDYLNFLNNQLSKDTARIQGEISSLDIRDKVVYFSLKDSKDESVINCLIWKNVYELNGVEFEVGMEIILSGCPDIYKPSGRLSFKASSVELVGEGALKIAYEKLKAKLQKEGLFDEARKKPIPLYPNKIGLITSKSGAVIADFSTNIGRFGYKISLIDSRVEGQLATEELLNSIKTFRNKDIDVLVIIRGGGSMESFLPFNNEVLIKEIASFPVPVLVGIGHEKDVSLLALASDMMFSTPTAVANYLNESWEKAESVIILSEQKVFRKFQNTIQENKDYIRDSLDIMKNTFQKIFNDFSKAQESLKIGFKSIKDQMVDIDRRINGVLIPVFRKINFSISGIRNNISDSIIKEIFEGFIDAKNKIKESLISYQKQLINNNPKRQLKLGYSIVTKNGRILKTTSQIQKGDIVSVGLSEGVFDSEVKIIKNN